MFSYVDMGVTGAALAENRRRWMPLELEFPGYCEQPDLGARNQTQVRRESYTPVSPEAFFFFWP